MGRLPRIVAELSQRRGISVRLLIPALLAIGCTSTELGPHPAPDRIAHRDGRYVMGTVLEVALEARTRARAVQATGALLDRAAELEAVLSTWRPESPASGLNSHAGGAPRSVPAELERLLRDSVAFSAATGGAFDVTIGPLVELWREAAERGRIPTEAEIQAARARVGPEHVRFLPGGVRLDEGTRIDFGGVAKGFALDRLGEQLSERGIGHALISFGQSSLLARGAPSGSPGWRVLVRDAAGGFAGVLTLRDRSLSVSGSLGQWTEIEGRRFGHVIDPRSGRPLQRAVQALVVASSGARAEALSKALLILPAEEALALLESEPGAEGALIDARGGLEATSGFQAAVSFEAAGGAGAPLEAAGGAGAPLEAAGGAGAPLKSAGEAGAP